MKHLLYTVANKCLIPSVDRLTNFMLKMPFLKSSKTGKLC